MAERMFAASAVLEGLATAECTRPQHADGVIVGRCRACPVCRQHERMLGHLDWLRWMVHRGILSGDTLVAGAPPIVTVGQMEEVWRDE